MNPFSSNPSFALQMVRVRHAELVAQADVRRVNRQQARLPRGRR